MENLGGEKEFSVKKSLLSRFPVEIGILLVSLVFHIYVALSPENNLVMTWFNSDDAFYYFKVAGNIVSGHGMTFDGINLTNGFHPLWLLICLPVFWTARFSLILPLRMIVLVSGLLNAGTGILLYHFLRVHLSRMVAMVASVVWVFTPAIHTVVVQNGMETSLSAFFLMLLIYLANRWHDQVVLSWKNWAWLGFVGALAILARLDNIFVVMLFGVWFALSLTTNYLRTIVTGDLAMIFIAGLLSYYIRVHVGIFYVTYSYSLPFLIGFGFIVKPLLFFLFGLYKTSGERFSWKILGNSTLAVTLSSLIIGISLLALQWLHIFPDLPRSILIICQILIIDWTGTWFGVLGLRLVAGMVFPKEIADESVPLISSWQFWKTSFLRSLGYYLPIAMLLGAYLGGNLLFIGAAMPISGQIKHWWSTLPYPIYGTVVRSIPTVFGLSSEMSTWKLALSPILFVGSLAENFLKPKYVFAIKIATGVILLVILLILVRPQKKWIITKLDRMGLFALFLGLYAQIFSYTATSYLHMRSWYWVGEMLFTIICLSILLEILWLGLKKWGFKVKVWQVMLSMLGLIPIIALGSSLWQNFPPVHPPGYREAYLDEVHGLEAATEPGAIIGMTGGGTDAYFIENRTIVNLDGLINSPAYFQALKSGQGLAFLNRLPLGYVFGGQYMIEDSDPYGNLFANHLNLMGKIADFNLYRYIP